MAGVTVVFDARELAEIGRAMRAVSRAKLGPLLADIADRGESETRKRIEDGGPAPDGTDWPARHPSYENPHPLLNRDGALVDSIETDASEDTAIWGSGLWGSGLVYARIHQLGGTIVPRNASALFFTLGGNDVIARSVTIPARPYLGYGAPERQGVEDVVEDWLEESLRHGR